MAFTAPDEELEKPPASGGFSAPATDIPVTGNPATGFSAPKDDTDAQAESLAQKDHAEIFAHAAHNPADYETAYQADKLRRARPLTAKAGEALATVGSAIAHPIRTATPVFNFLAGIPETALHTAQQVANATEGTVAQYTPVGRMLSVLPKKQSETLQAENTLAAQHGEETLKHMANVVGRAMDAVDPSTWLYETPKMKEDQERAVFAQRVQAAKNELQLARGEPLDTGAIAGIYHAAGQQPSAEVGPEALRQYGVPQADQGTVSRMSAASDPTMLALAAAPGLPGAATIGGGATELAGKAIGGTGRAVSAVTHALSPLNIVRRVLNPSSIATDALKEGGARGLQSIGRALESQGKELRTGLPSPLTTEAATAAAKGESAIGTNIQRKIGDTAAHAAQTAVGMAPLNAALAEGDPKAFAETEVGAAAFGGTLNAFRRNRPILVEGVRPHLRSEGARALWEAGGPEGNDPLAARSAAYVMSLPEAARDNTLEAIGALQGLPTTSRSGPTRAKVYVLSEPDYLAEQKRRFPEEKEGQEQKVAMGGGRGFFMTDEGAAFVNGDYHSGLGPTELSHTIGHEFGGHAAINVMKAAGAKGGALYNGLIGAATDALMPRGRPSPEFLRFIDGYNRAFDPTGATKRLDAQNPEAIEEFIAETAGQIMASRGAGEIAIPQNIQDRISQGIGRFMGNMIGLDTRKVGTQTHFGREEVGAVTQAVQDTLGQIVGMKLRGGAELPEAPKTDTTRIAELQQTLATPRPVPGSPVESVQAWLANRRAAQRELNDLQTQPEAAFPAAGAPPQPPSRPVAPPTPQAPPAGNRAQVAAALRLNGLTAAEASVWAQNAEGSTTADMVLDALKKRAAQKFPSQTPTAPVTGNPATEPVLPPAANVTPEDQPLTNEPAPPSETTQLPTEPTRTAVIPSRPTDAPEPAPLSPETIAALVSKAEADVKASRTSRHKADTLPKAVTDAQVDAVAAAHEQGLPANYQGVRSRTDALGKKTISGTFNPSRPFDAFLLKLADISEKHVGILQDLQSKLGTTVTVNYGHAPESEGKVTAGSRKAAQQAASAQARASGEAPTQAEDKNFIPLDVRFNKGKDTPSITVVGASPEKLLSNFNHAASAVSELGGEVPYRDIHDPHLVADMKGVARNHANGWKGDGSARIQGFPDVSVPEPGEGFKPYPIPQERFEFLNLILGDESAKTGKKGTSPDQQLKQGLAAKNQIPMTEAGETNILRESINHAKGQVVGPDGQPTTWSKATIENPLSEALRVDLINDVKPEVSNEDASIRPHGYARDISRFFAEGSPNRLYSAAGFLPDTGAPKSAQERARERIAASGKSSFMPSDKPTPEEGPTASGQEPSEEQRNPPLSGETLPSSALSAIPRNENLMEEAEAAGLEPSLDTIKGVLRNDRSAMDKLRKMIMDKTGRPAKWMPREKLSAENATAKADEFSRDDPETWPADLGKGVEEPTDRIDSWQWALTPKERAQIRTEMKQPGYDLTRFETKAKQEFARRQQAAQMRADSLKKQVEKAKFFFMPDDKRKPQERARERVSQRVQAGTGQKRELATK